MKVDGSFQIACRAFELMPLAGRVRVIEEFARLQYPNPLDRWHEAVYRVVVHLTPAHDREDQP